jgi:phage/plasmid-like protein (TIGR03299 family)
MSAEKLTTLNTSTLIGFADKRGHAWHYRADLQGDESNHYPGAIPVEDVRRRLFYWDAVEGELTATALTPDGVVTTRDEQRKAIMHPITGRVFGVFGKESYKMHQFNRWLLDEVAVIVDDELSIGSAGVLKEGAVAWVSIEVPDTITTPEGVAFRPNLLATTAHDGSLATTFKRVVTNVVCDNTHGIALREDGQQFKVKHSRNSLNALTDVRDALALVHSIADDFAAEVATLTAQKVTDYTWTKFLDAYAPLKDDQSGRSRTMAENKRDSLNRLYNHDARVAPWRGTAWGVVQAVNTMVHHEGIVRGTSREERNMLRAVTGGADKLDTSTIDMLGAVS